MNKNGHELQAWLWLWLPLGLFVLIFGTALISQDTYDTFFTGEIGAIELATPLMLVPAVISGLIIIFNIDKFVAKRISIWILLVTLACIYIAGEEASWGQHLLGWDTPGWISKLNKQ